MNTKTKVLAVILFGAITLAALNRVSGSDAPSTQATSQPYRLVLRMVAGSEPLESVFVIVSPEGYPSLSTFAKLRSTIEATVKSPATINWEPSDVKNGPEPLDSQAEVDALASFCKEHNIKFVLIPAG